MNTPSKKLRALLRGIHDLSIEELMELNHYVVEQIRFLETVHTHEQMMEFEPGSRVSFESKYGRQTGTLIKFNRKTVTVVTDNGQKWNISPHLLSPVKDAKPTQSFVYANEKQLE